MCLAVPNGMSGHTERGGGLDPSSLLSPLHFLPRLLSRTVRLQGSMAPSMWVPEKTNTPMRSKYPCGFQVNQCSWLVTNTQSSDRKIWVEGRASTATSSQQKFMYSYMTHPLRCNISQDIWYANDHCEAPGQLAVHLGVL